MDYHEKLIEELAGLSKLFDDKKIGWKTYNHYRDRICDLIRQYENINHHAEICLSEIIAGTAIVPGELK